jgi:hypothetical protein
MLGTRRTWWDITGVSRRHGIQRELDAWLGAQMTVGSGTTWVARMVSRSKRWV